MHSQSSPHNSFEGTASNFDGAAKLLNPPAKDRLGRDGCLDKSSVAVPPRESGNTVYSMDTDTVYQFYDLGSRTEALSRHESFSSFKKASSPAKARKSGKT